MISVFFPYYQCGDSERQSEIDLCLKQNAEHPDIKNLFVVIDDGCECPVITTNIKVIHVDRRLTYKYWIELTEQYLDDGISVLCNSDIYFDDSISKIMSVLEKPKSFMALSRWELLGNTTEKHPNPHWSQDTWAVRVGEEFSPSFRHLLDFPMGVPRCDNKIAYLFAVQGWQVFNPVEHVKSIHAHETQMRTYHKKLDDRILGGVAYVHPGDGLKGEAQLDFDVWVKRTGAISKVSLNKTMEKWIKEADAEAKATQEAKVASVAFSKATPSELATAMTSGVVRWSSSPNFRALEKGGQVFFNNPYATEHRIKSIKEEYENNSALGNVSGLIPPVLKTFVGDIGLKPTSPEDLNFWQYPCATEKQAYENHLSIEPGHHVDSDNRVVNIYVPLPWATYVDKKSFPESYLFRVKQLINTYKKIAESNDFSLRVHSVCQHIHWVRMLEKAEWLGITDFHLSHKDSKSEGIQKELGTSLTLHGWTLIAVNYETPDRSEGMERKPMSERKLLASFIGAHMPHYRDDSRIKLFEAAKACGRDDVFVDLGNEWHFNKVVYEEQVLSREVAAHHIDEHHQRTFRYNSILSDSKFSLCPEGAGPNTLRFWESIAVGSIPVIHSRDLSVFTEKKIANEILSYVILWEESINKSMLKYLASINPETIRLNSQKLMSLYEKISKLRTF